MVAKICGPIILISVVLIVLINLLPSSAPSVTSTATPEQDRTASDKAAPDAAKKEADQVRAHAERRAIVLCQEEFKRHAMHPSTVDFPMLDKYLIGGWQEDTFTYQAGPTAKNGFNLELRYVMQCAVRMGKSYGLLLKKHADLGRYKTY